MKVAANVQQTRSELPPIDPDLYTRLEQDILTRGVVIPIVVDRQGNVIDGKVRHEIASRHGLSCPKVFYEGDTGDLRTTLNTYRRQLTRQQVREIIAWEIAKTPHHSDRRIAARVGCDKNTVGRVRATGEFHQTIREGADGVTRRLPTLVHAPTRTLARQTQALLDVVEDLPHGVVTQRKLRNLAFQERVAAEAAQPVAQLPSQVEIHHGDCFDFCWEKWEGRAALVMADPPWLAEIEFRRQFAALCARLLKPGGIVACYTGIFHLPGWLAAFDSIEELKYVWTISFRNLGNSKVRVHGQGRGRLVIQSAWRPNAVYSKGDAVCDRVLFDSIESLKEKSHHPWQQPVGESLRLIETFAKPGDLVVDPTCGSGTSGLAVIRAGQGRRWIGVDRDPKAIQSAKVRLSKSKELRQD